jgi:hypothetical protein
MRLQPKRTGSDGRINASIFRPRGFVATAMGFAMMAAAQWYSEFIAILWPGARCCANRRWWGLPACDRKSMPLADQRSQFDLLLRHESDFQQHLLASRVGTHLGRSQNDVTLGSRSLGLAKPAEKI